MRKFLPATNKECPESRRVRPALATTVLGLCLLVWIPHTVMGQSLQPDTSEKSSPQAVHYILSTEKADAKSVVLAMRIREQETISGETLVKLHPTNLLKALQMLDPSLVLDGRSSVDGSDPNYTPQTITLNVEKSFGTYSSGMSNVLVIVDGYEITYERLADFDITRVKEVKIIKDAAGVAHYGIRGANGVIDITTKTPQKGAISLSYRFDGGIASADKSYYDLMNASQKLALEKELGMYVGNEALYNERLANGNTDWLKLPLQTPFRHRHHINVEGGDNALRISAGLMLEPGSKGVMKGSKRDRYGVTGVIYYHMGRFRVADYVSADLIHGTSSPYGFFADYITVNPYYSPYDENGKAVNILGEGTFSQQYSPLYEASLSNFSKNKSTRLQNNLMASFDIADWLRLRGSFAFTKDNIKYDQFVSPSSNVFANAGDADLMGSYEIRREDRTVYEEHLDLDFLKRYELHTFSATLGIHSYASEIYADNYEAMGIPNGNMSYVSFAKRYNYARRPGGREYKDRLFGVYLTAGYDYDGRYAAQAVLRVDRSSQLAPDKQWAPNWAVSGTWNMKNEKWLSGSRTVNLMQLSAGVGQTAASQSVYNMVNPTYYYAIDDPYIDAPTAKFGLVSLMQDLTFNNSLKWRTDFRFDARFKIMLWHRVRAEISYYYMNSADIAIMQRNNPATGKMLKWVNDGEVSNQGVQFSLAGTIIQNNGFNLNLVVSGIANKNKIESAPEHEYILNGNSSNYYASPIYSGVPVDAIYAMTSNGIDPATGIETYVQNSYASRGSATPKLMGNLGLTGSAKQWDFGAMLSYSFGGKVYDNYSQLFTDFATIGQSGPVKILDKWRKSGDNATYQGFQDQSFGYSTRFVKTENTLSLGSAYVGYNFDPSIAAKLYMKGLYIGLTGNDLFYFSSEKLPRGLLYPCARSFTLTLKATF